MLQQTIPLDAKVFNLFLHSLQSVLSAADGKLVVNDLLYKVLFQDPLKLLFGVFFRVLPLAECPMERMIHSIDTISSPLFAQLALLHPPFPLVESLGDDFEVRIAEEKSYNGSMHLALLLLRFLGKIVSNIFLTVALGAQKVL